MGTVQFIRRKFLSRLSIFVKTSANLAFLETRSGSGTLHNDGFYRTISYGIINKERYTEECWSNHLEMTLLHNYDSLDRQSPLQSIACATQVPNLAPCPLTKFDDRTRNLELQSRIQSRNVVMWKVGTRLLWGFRAFGKA